MSDSSFLRGLYAAIDRLIANLRTNGRQELAEVLHHRLHLVAWSSSSELVGEIQQVLGDALAHQRAGLSEDLYFEMCRIVEMIKVNDSKPGAFEKQGD